MDLPQPYEIARVRQPLKISTITALTKALELQHPDEVIYIRASRDEAWIVFYLEGKEAVGK
jgi:hypothetical protein